MCTAVVSRLKDIQVYSPSKIAQLILMPSADNPKNDLAGSVAGSCAAARARSEATGAMVLMQSFWSIVMSLLMSLLIVRTSETSQVALQIIPPALRLCLRIQEEPSIKASHPLKSLLQHEVAQRRVVRNVDSSDKGLLVSNDRC